MFYCSCVWLNRVVFEILSQQLNSRLATIDYLNYNKHKYYEKYNIWESSPFEIPSEFFTSPRHKKNHPSDNFQD